MNTAVKEKLTRHKRTLVMYPAIEEKWVAADKRTEENMLITTMVSILANKVRPLWDSLGTHMESRDGPTPMHGQVKKRIET